ncbi:hypothetical protein J6X90_00005, partial [Candidatus Saccharibacteria bacterium]|nr:hypothetical protein [Candidatus Saccharibacteria bacterium]
MEPTNTTPIQPLNRPKTPETPLYEKKKFNLVTFLIILAALLGIAIVVVFIMSNTSTSASDANTETSSITSTHETFVNRDQNGIPEGIEDSLYYEVIVNDECEAYVQEYDRAEKATKKTLIAYGAFDRTRRADGTILITGRKLLSDDFPEIQVVDKKYNWMSFANTIGETPVTTISAPAGHENYTLNLYDDDTLWLVNSAGETASERSIFVASAVSGIST